MVNDDPEFVIEISAPVDRQTAEALQLEATRLLERHGLRIRSVAVTASGEAAAADPGSDSA